MNSKDIFKLGFILKRKESEDKVIQTIEKIRRKRIKSNVPFSDRLNDFIKNKHRYLTSTKNIFEFTDIDNFDPNDPHGTFLEHKDYFKQTGKIRIWKGASNNTIFGLPEINWYFRAWHDHTHITNDLGYSPIEESIVAEIQKSQLPEDWIIERKLIDIEVTGQVQYHHLNGEFVKDQRQFTAIYYQDPMTALKQKGL